LSVVGFGERGPSLSVKRRPGWGKKARGLFRKRKRNPVLMHRFMYHCERAKRHARHGDVARSARRINRAVRYCRFGAPHEINLDSKCS